MLGGQANAEALVIELDDIRQCSGRTVMEVWRARRQPAPDQPFDFADIAHLPLIMARPISVT